MKLDSKRLTTVEARSENKDGATKKRAVPNRKELSAASETLSSDEG